MCGASLRDAYIQTLHYMVDSLASFLVWGRRELIIVDGELGEHKFRIQVTDMVKSFHFICGQRRRRSYGTIRRRKRDLDFANQDFVRLNVASKNVKPENNSASPFCPMPQSPWCKAKWP